MSRHAVADDCEKPNAKAPNIHCTWLSIDGTRATPDIGHLYCDIYIYIYLHWI